MKRFIFPFIFILLAFGVFVMRPSSETTEEVIVSDSIQEILNEKAVNNPEIIGEVTNEEQAEILEDETIEVINSDGEIVSDEPETSERISIPGKVSLDLPFIVQAPHANWDLPYSEACEEASLLMVHHYYENTKNFTQDEMKTAIDGIITWGDETFGSYDTSAETTARYFTEKLGYEESSVTVLYDFTIDDIKTLISEGIPVIIPAAGRELGNKFFQDPGPLYHMLVITGYTDNTFITHDPGTKRGASYEYDQQVLFDAIHDLTPDREQIATGKKALLIVNP